MNSTANKYSGAVSCTHREAEAAVETLAHAALTDRASWVHAVRQPLQVCVCVLCAYWWVCVQ